MELNAIITDANGDIGSRKRHEPPTDESHQPAKRLNMGGSFTLKVANVAAATQIAARAVPAPASTQQQPRTPTKTITISQSGIVTPPPKGLLLNPQGVLISSPAKSGAALLNPAAGSKTPPAKTALIPPKSPAPIAPAVSTVAAAAPAVQTITLSPSRVIIKNVAGVTSVKSFAAGNNFQHVQVAEIVNQGKVVTSAATSHIQPTLTVKGMTSKPITFAAGRVVPSLGTAQRILLPATSSGTIVGMQAQQGGVAQPQTFSIIASSTGGSGGLPGGGSQMVVLSADVLARLQSVSASQSATSIITTSAAPMTMKKVDSYIPIASNDPSVGGSSASSRLSYVSNSAAASGVNAVSNSSDQAPGRPRKPCNCTKSQCLKLYCDCFANGEFCHGCNCTNCANNLGHEEERQRAIKSCLDRNPQAFHPKIGLQQMASTAGGAADVTRRHQKGCNCKRSGCLKNYCECYEAKIMCGSMCKCVGCKNFEESPERKTLMHLADAAEVRVQQQTAAKNKFSSQFHELETKACAAGSDKALFRKWTFVVPPDEDQCCASIVKNKQGASLPATMQHIRERRLAYSYVTYDVVEAICNCLLVQCQEAEQAKCKKAVIERLVMEEFGHSLLQIIQAANSRPKD